MRGTGKKVERLQKKEDKLVYKGSKAVDEGRMKKADRLLGRAAKVEDRKIKTADKKQSVTMEVDGKEYGAMQKKKVVRGKDGLVKKTVVKTKGTPGSVIGRSREVKRYRQL
jgi:hypothetical protein